MSDDGERTVHTIRQRAGQELRATLSDYRGELYISLRTYYQPNEGTWLPTKKGITVNASMLGELESAIGALRRAIEAEPR